MYRSDSRRILATLIRLLGDMDLAEDALHEAFSAAMVQWPQEGIPANPRAWLVSAGRFKGIDQQRRNARMDTSAEVVEAFADPSGKDPADLIDDVVEDDQLRLIFTCCHPALAPEARVALTLREVCGLTTEAIASAYLTTPSTLAQRIVRAKAKIRSARIPYQVPAPAELPERLEAVLRVIYLVFNEGYAASSGDSLTRHDLSAEALRVCRLLSALLPEPEVHGLLALMLFHDSRRNARASGSGDLILLEDQDRSLWLRGEIEEASVLVGKAFSSGKIGVYTLQAAIAAEHAGATTPASTDWRRIVGLYDLLLQLEPSPVVELNRAVAVAMRDGPSAGVTLIDGILERGHLGGYPFAHSARGELCKRAGRNDDARLSFQKALALAQQEPLRRFLERRLKELPP